MHDMFVGLTRRALLWKEYVKNDCVETELDRTTIHRIAFSHFAILIPKAI